MRKTARDFSVVVDKMDELAKEMGVSRAKILRLIGANPAHPARWKDGKIQPRYDMLVRLAHIESEHTKEPFEKTFSAWLADGKLEFDPKQDHNAIKMNLESRVQGQIVTSKDDLMETPVRQEDFDFLKDMSEAFRKHSGDKVTIRELAIFLRSRK